LIALEPKIQDNKDCKFLNELMKTPQTAGLNPKGFTVIELIIILTIISILVTLAVPEVLDSRRNTRALACGTALNQIEAAKSAWAREYPGQAIRTSNDLARYFPGGTIPPDPWNVGFRDVLSLNIATWHPYDGIPAYEPAGASPTADTDTNGILDIKENGHNDLGRPRMN